LRRMGVVRGGGSLAGTQRIRGHEDEAHGKEGQSGGEGGGHGDQVVEVCSAGQSYREGPCPDVTWVTPLRFCWMGKLTEDPRTQKRLLGPEDVRKAWGLLKLVDAKLKPWFGSTFL
jgi:hypothetical protein